jgi:hypothetical protein
MPSWVQAVAAAPVQTSLAFQNPSLMTVSFTLSFVTATGVKRMLGMLLVPAALLWTVRPPTVVGVWPLRMSAVLKLALEVAGHLAFAPRRRFCATAIQRDCFPPPALLQ